MSALNGVKPRYDNKGSEFGEMHRLLPKNCGMFDIDRMSAVATLNLELSNQDVGFLEYRTNFNDGSIEFKAMFEVKHKDTEHVRNALKCTIGTSTWAQAQMCKILKCRYFFVIATEGKQPFRFYELKDNNSSYLGTLDYTPDNKKNAVNFFWKLIGLQE